MFRLHNLLFKFFQFHSVKMEQPPKTVGDSVSKALQPGETKSNKERKTQHKKFRRRIETEKKHKRMFASQTKTDSEIPQVLRDINEEEKKVPIIEISSSESDIPQIMATEIIDSNSDDDDDKTEFVQLPQESVYYVKSDTDDDEEEDAMEEKQLKQEPDIISISSSEESKEKENEQNIADEQIDEEQSCVHPTGWGRAWFT